jgi:hypothetical protein
VAHERWARRGHAHGTAHGVVITRVPVYPLPSAESGRGAPPAGFKRAPAHGTQWALLPFGVPAPGSCVAPGLHAHGGRAKGGSITVPGRTPFAQHPRTQTEGARQRGRMRLPLRAPYFARTWWGRGGNGGDAISYVAAHLHALLSQTGMACSCAPLTCLSGRQGGRSCTAFPCPVGAQTRPPFMHKRGQDQWESGSGREGAPRLLSC